jgi:hypothetical protein
VFDLNGMFIGNAVQPKVAVARLCTDF